MFTNWIMRGIVRTLLRLTVLIVSELLLFNANSAIFQLYHGENKLMFNEMMMRPTRLVDFFSASSLKQQSVDRHVAPLEHIVLILSKPVFVLSP
jgi:hypothetical protein